MAAQIPSRVDAVLRRMHPTGKYEDLLAERLDQHLSWDQLHTLVRDLKMIPGVCVYLDPAESEDDRSHVIYVGTALAPAWDSFNRVLSDPEREAALHSLGSITYWIIRLSRVGPFWMDFWNQFVRLGHRIVPEFSTRAPTLEWQFITSTVSSILSSYSLEFLSSASLHVPVNWMTTDERDLLVERGLDPTPTVYDGLFSNLY